jgi:hypothetical protein
MIKCRPPKEPKKPAICEGYTNDEGCQLPPVPLPPTAPVKLIAASPASSKPLISVNDLVSTGRVDSGYTTRHDLSIDEAVKNVDVALNELKRAREVFSRVLDDGVFGNSVSRALTDNGTSNVNINLNVARDNFEIAVRDLVEATANDYVNSHGLDWNKALTQARRDIVSAYRSQLVPNDRDKDKDMAMNTLNLILDTVNNFIRDNTDTAQPQTDIIGIALADR